MLKKIKLFLFLSFIFFSNNLLQAQTAKEQFKDGYTNTGAGMGFDTENITGSEKIYSIIATLINFFLSFLAVIFFVLTIYGGYLWMTARGNESQVETAKKLIKNTVIGLILILLAYAITKFVGNII